MKRLLNICTGKSGKLIVFSSIVFMLIGCASAGGVATGGLYGNTKAPILLTANKVGKKVGVGQYKSVLGISLKGDCSIDKLTKEAGITRVSHIDLQGTNVLTLFAKTTIYVYGE